MVIRLAQVDHGFNLVGISKDLRFPRSKDLQELSKFGFLFFRDLFTFFAAVFTLVVVDEEYTLTQACISVVIKLNTLNFILNVISGFSFTAFMSKKELAALVVSNCCPTRK